QYCHGAAYEAHRDAGRSGQRGADRAGGGGAARVGVGLCTRRRRARGEPRARTRRSDADARRSVRRVRRCARAGGCGAATGGRGGGPAPIPASVTPWSSEPIGEQHDLSRFSCGNETLDRWLREQALRAHRAGVSRTTVWVSPNDPTVVAYHAIAPTQLARIDLPRRALSAGYSMLPGFLI